MIKFLRLAYLNMVLRKHLRHEMYLRSMAESFALGAKEIREKHLPAIEAKIEAYGE